MYSGYDGPSLYFKETFNPQVFDKTMIRIKVIVI